MSKIVDSIDALKARIAAVLPNHKELTNPYETDENPETILKQGFGVRIREGVNSNRSGSCILSVQRTIEIVLTRKYYAYELNRTAKENTEKALLEDQFLVLQDIEGEPTIGNSNAVTQFGYTGDSGIEFVFSDEKPFYQLVSQFRLEYLEDLN